MQARFISGNCFLTVSLHRQEGATVFAVEVLAGELICRSCEIATPGAVASVRSGGRTVGNHVVRRGATALVTFGETLHIVANDEMRIEVWAEFRWALS